MSVEACTIEKSMCALLVVFAHLIHVMEQKQSNFKLEKEIKTDDLPPSFVFKKKKFTMGLHGPV